MGDLEELYQKMSELGVFSSQYAYSQFEQDMAYPSQVKALYENLRENELVDVEEEDFINTYLIKKKNRWRNFRQRIAYLVYPPRRCACTCPRCGSVSRISNR
jgi:hypothetical protein